jgi:hypothetical protein
MKAAGKDAYIGQASEVNRFVFWKDAEGVTVVVSGVHVTDDELLLVANSVEAA